MGTASHRAKNVIDTEGDWEIFQARTNGQMDNGEAIIGLLSSGGSIRRATLLTRSANANGFFQVVFLRNGNDRAAAITAGDLQEIHVLSAGNVSFQYNYNFACDQIDVVNTSGAFIFASLILYGESS